MRLGDALVALVLDRLRGVSILVTLVALRDLILDFNALEGGVLLDPFDVFVDDLLDSI